jgi:glycosyl transferase family 87
VSTQETQIIFQSHRRLLRIFVAGMLGVHLLFFVMQWERIARGYPDFTIFYAAATIVGEGSGQKMYDGEAQYRVQKEFAGDIDSRRGPLPYNHPPFEALIFLPLTLLPYRYAFLVWDMLNTVALFGVSLILRRHLSVLRAIRPWEFVLGSMAFFPVFATLLQGQDSILLLLLFVLGFNALKIDADFSAGCWFALGAFKFQLVLPLILLVVFWRRKRVAMGFVLVSCILALISIMLVGWEGMLRYPAYVLRIARASSLGGVPPQLMPNVRGLVEGWSVTSGSFNFGTVVGAALVLMVSSIVFFFAAWPRAGPQERELDLRFSLAVIVTVLVSWHTNAHDLSLLILPLTLVADYFIALPVKTRRRNLALIVPVLPILVSPLWIVLWLGNGKVNLMALPLLWWVWEVGRELSPVASRVTELRS